jgi:hypothetical protein
MPDDNTYNKDDNNHDDISNDNTRLQHQVTTPKDNIRWQYNKTTQNNSRWQHRTPQMTNQMTTKMKTQKTTKDDNPDL